MKGESIKRLEDGGIRNLTRETLLKSTISSLYSRPQDEQIIAREHDRFDDYAREMRQRHHDIEGPVEYIDLQLRIPVSAGFPKERKERVAKFMADAMRDNFMNRESADLMPLESHRT